MPRTYEPIATRTLNTDTSTITFSSIPSTYTDLVLFVNAYSTSTGNDNIGLVINGDSGTNYSWTRMYGVSGVSGTTRTASANQIGQGTFGTGSTKYSPVIYNIMNYSNATTFKTVLGRANEPVGQVTTLVGLWRSTAAITSLTLNLYASGANYGAGSTFTLYGIKAA